MISRPTVFVIGAGARLAEEFPLGSELIDMLRQSLSELPANSRNSVGNPDLQLAIENIASPNGGPTKSELEEAAKRLVKTMSGSVYSIDNLIHSHSNDSAFAIVAKLAIAQCIANCERKSGLRLDDGVKFNARCIPKSYWLNTLATYLFRGSSLDNLFSNVKFISFNYDRCIEQGLRIATANYFDLTDDQCAAINDNLEVLHPYGDLGQLSFSNSASGGQFGARVSSAQVLEMSKRLRTFTEGSENEQKSKISAVINWAERIVFLGFGFIDLNVGLLGKAQSRSSKLIYGTAYNMSESNVDIVYRNIKAQLDGGDGERFRQNLTADDLLHFYERSIFC
jgi:hypothetical protein